MRKLLRSGEAVGCGASIEFDNGEVVYSRILCVRAGGRAVIGAAAALRLGQTDSQNV
jgi:hypothetical protein